MGLFSALAYQLAGNAVHVFSPMEYAPLRAVLDGNVAEWREATSRAEH